MGVLLSIRDQALAALQADTALQPVRLIARTKNDIKNEITTTLAKFGICALVMTPSAKMRGSNAPGPMLDPVNLVIDVIEQVGFNRGTKGTKLPAEDVAEQIAWRLHAVNHPGRKDAHPLICEEIEEISDAEFLAYRVKFRTSGQLPGINQENR
ncbi:MAG: hypothetical protein R6X19_03375 [Kiritimatiellia bacterium]